jgi:hypothetical protein
VLIPFGKTLSLVGAKQAIPHKKCYTASTGWNIKRRHKVGNRKRILLLAGVLFVLAGFSWVACAPAPGEPQEAVEEKPAEPTAEPVVEAGPVDLHIEVEEHFLDTTPEPFTASGKAVDEGMICPTGTVFESSIVYTNTEGPFTLMDVVKQFDCDDGSGTFEISMNIELEKATSKTTADWRVMGGTGAYSDLAGEGTLVGEPVVPNTIINDSYDGKVH